MFETVDILTIFGPRFFRSIASYFQTQVFGCGEGILLAGTLCDRFYILAQGQIEILAGLRKSSRKVETKIMNSPKPHAKKRRKSMSVIQQAQIKKYETDKTIWDVCPCIEAQLAFQL